MTKAFASFAILAVSGASVIALPSFAPKADANERLAIGKVRSARSPIAELFETDLAGFRNFMSATAVRKQRLWKLVL